MISNLLEKQLGYRPFIYNSTIGVFVFTPRKESFQRVNDELMPFLSSDHLNSTSVFDTSKRDGFFMSMTRNILSSRAISAYSWKRHISSFLLQLKPFHVSSSSSHAEVFLRFKNCIQEHGSPSQRLFLGKQTRLVFRKAFMKSLEDQLKN